MDQKRLLLAFVLSAAVLFGWTYFADRRQPQPNNANTPPAANTNTTTASQSVAATPTPAQNQAPTNTAPDNTPQRAITIDTPLYKVVIDSQGAVARSWVIKQNKDTRRPLYSIAGDKNNRQPLELIPQAASVPENLRQEVRATPLRLRTGDANFDALLSSRNYEVSGVDETAGDAQLTLKPGETKTVGFVFRDAASGTEVIKTLSFDAETYSVGLNVKLTRGGQPVPSAQLAIGPSIGDQGVTHYTFYSVAPDGVAVVDGKAQLFYGKSIHETKEHPDQQSVGGTIDWAGVGDTYFAMLAVPAKKAQGLEFHTTRYEHEAAGKKEDRFLITGLLTVPTDGSTGTQLYAGPKDHYLLTAASERIGQTVSRELDLESAINYGRLGFITRPLAVPILKAIKLLNQWTGSYGVAIILFTIIIYSLFFPLKWRSTRAMKKAQKHAPRMKEVQEKMKGLKPNDPRLRELQVEQLRLMKEANPLGGCLPLLIQMPFLFALYTAITISIDFRQASFLWITDLSAADHTHVLPVLMAGSMVILQFITPQPSADPLQRKMMAVMLPAFMLYIMWSAPAGLLVYWLMANIVGFSQQMIINRLLKSEDDEEPQPPGQKSKERPAKSLSPARAS